MIKLPTLSELYNSILANLNAEYGINISTKKKVALRAFSATQGGETWLQYKVLGFVQKQVWPDTADSEFIGGTLERFGRIGIGRNPNPAVAGQYTVEITGTIGAVVPAQSTWKSNDTSLNPGIIYILDSNYTLVAATDSILLRALTQGNAGKLDIGDTLTCVSPIPLVGNSAEVLSETVQPLEAESLEDYRTVVLNRFRIEAQGGSPGDYRIWSSDAQGVAAVYPYSKIGEVNANNIYIEALAADSIDGKGTPTQQIIDDVEAVCEQNPDTTLSTPERSRRPMSVINYFLPVTPLDVDIDIVGFTGVTITQKNLILAAIKTSLANTRPYVPGVDILAEKNDILDKNKINAVIYSQIPGAVYTSINLRVNGVDLSTYTFVGEFIPYLNSISYL